MGRMRASANEQSGRWSCARQHQRGRGTPPRARFVCFLQINDSTYPSMALEAQNASQPARCCALGRSRSLWFARVHSGPSWSILVHPGPSWSILVRSRALSLRSRALACALVCGAPSASCPRAGWLAGWLVCWCRKNKRRSARTTQTTKQTQITQRKSSAPCTHEACFSASSGGARTNSSSVP